jgi:hypothetical protein
MNNNMNLYSYIPFNMTPPGIGTHNLCIWDTLIIQLRYKVSGIFRCPIQIPYL